MPDCHEYLGWSVGYCRRPTTADSNFCAEHTAAREAFAPHSTVTNRKDS